MKQSPGQEASPRTVRPWQGDTAKKGVLTEWIVQEPSIQSSNDETFKAYAWLTICHFNLKDVSRWGQLLSLVGDSKNKIPLRMRGKTSPAF
jgi:hypothetical protein